MLFSPKSIYEESSGLIYLLLNIIFFTKQFRLTCQTESVEKMLILQFQTIVDLVSFKTVILFKFYFKILLDLLPDLLTNDYRWAYHKDHLADLPVFHYI